MRALDLKLMRDLRRLWAQALAIAMVLACGVMVILMSSGLSAALDETKRAYYERNRFADVFVTARRVPESLMREVAAIPGIAASEARISGNAILDIPGRPEAAIGQIISLPLVGEPRLNLPLMRAGDWPANGSLDQVVINEPFAEANGFVIGDGFYANLNGRKRWLTITGTVLSPEFIYTIGPGALMPDAEAFGVLWMSRPSVAASFDMQGAVNNIALTLARGANEQHVLDRLDDLLEPYGGLGAHGRDLQISHAFVQTEIDQLENIAYVLPPVFLGITVFLVNMVIGRIVALERSEIGLLKALGYTNWDVSLHYLLLAGLIAIIGIILGWISGAWMARQMGEIYAEFYDFPFLIHRMPISSYLVSALAAFGAATLGAANSAVIAARLAPAVAMAPPLPPRFRRGLLNRALEALRLSQPTMMILRDIIRWPGRAALSVLGLGLATSVLVVANFFDDAFDAMIDTGFYQSNRQDVILALSEEAPLAALEEIRRLPGVLQAEAQQFHPVTLRHGALTKRVSIEARMPDADLSRVVSDDGTVVVVPPGGLALSHRLAQQLDLRPGDTVQAEFMTGTRETLSFPVIATVDQVFGLGAYTDLEALDAALRRAPRLSVANVTLDAGETEAFHAAIKDTPALAAAVFMSDNRRAFIETIDENQNIMIGVYGILGILIALGVAYNAARVQLSERARELASLRILGFSRSEVSYVLIGQVLLLAIAAQPLGWWIGAAIARLMTNQFSSDLYVVPLVLQPATYAVASLTVLIVTAVSLLPVWRRLIQLDLVAVMKTRE
ncbi:MAG: FtsX-like permease family protein [Paracoccaceae bacterium]|nr:FtsX-like permease family protein [Paracoccaceae bacterium]